MNNIIDVHSAEKGLFWGNIRKRGAMY